MTVARPALSCALVAAVLLCFGPARAEEATPEAQAAALQKRYESLVPYSDFASFSQRMAAIRGLGALSTDLGRKHLLEIARRAKSIDDRIVAIVTLGPGLDAESAKALSGLVERKDDPLLVQALSDAYSLATSEEALAWLAGPGLQVTDPGVLLAAVDAQYLHADERARERLLEIFETSQGKERRIHLAHAALRAIGSIASRKDRTFLLRGPSYEDWRLRLAAADVMGLQKPIDLNIRNALKQLLHDEKSVVREAAALSTGRARIVELTDDLADLLQDAHLKTRRVALEALERMHHKNLGWDPEDWRRWWKTLAHEPERPLQQPSTSSASYYGVQVYSDRVLFIVDLSGSMAFPWGKDVEKTRIGVARAQLRKVLQDLDPDTLFNVIVFSDKVKAWRKGETLATRESVAAALTWIDKTFDKPEGGTFMHDALETAFAENPEVDTIFLLTDGLATDGEPIVPEAILASVNRWNRFRRVVVNTFALTLEDLDPDGLNKGNLVEIKRFMRRLAMLTGGECTVVSRLP